MTEQKKSPGDPTSAEVATLVAALSGIQAMKDYARGQDGSLPRLPPMGDMLFGLASLHLKNIQAMAELGQKQAQEMLKHARENKGALTGRSPLPRALVSVTLGTDSKDQSWCFVIRNKSAEDKKYSLPDLAEMRRVGTPACDDSVFTKISFLGADEKPRCDVDVPAGKEATLRLVLPPDERFERSNARYRASVILEASCGQSLELIVELLVKGSPSAAETKG